MNDMPKHPGTAGTYATGFLLSILFSALPFGLVELHVRSHHALIPHPMLIAVIVACAAAQLAAQLAFFFHIGHRQSRWNRIALCLTALFVCTVVGGSLWIMYNLSSRMMPETPGQMEEYMQSQDV